MNNFMDPTCLIDQAFQRASTTVPKPPDPKCINPNFPWDAYWPDDEAPTDCDVGECGLCHLGRYCPQGTSNPNLTLTVCESGFYCPNASAQIECPAGYYCPAPSVDPIPCTLGLYCPANMSVQPTWCEKGYFCKTPAEKEICPEGYYCLEGLAEPFACPFASMCEEGSYEPNRVAVLAFTLAALSIIVFAFIGITYLRYSVNRREATRHLNARMVIKDVIDMGNVSQTEPMIFKGFQQHTNPPCSIAFDELSLKVGDKVILQGVSGMFPHSSLVAIMGPSGAGKTTFLNVLTGKAHYGQVGGRATMNGHQPNVKDIRHEVGFVPQDDIVNDILTVRDNISWSAWLRLPADWSSSRKTDIIDDVISLLGLAHIQHSVVGSVEKRGISGGQRKRVNIGMELAADPSVLFLDEPTSGLDASTTQEILQRLREFSRLGISTAAVIHQPRYSAFLAFDYILLLGVGGRTVYLGPSQDALSYFQSIGFTCPARENPADFFLDVVSGLVPCETSPGFKPNDLFDFWVRRTWTDGCQELAKVDNLWESFKKFDAKCVDKLDVDELMRFFESVGVATERQKCVDLCSRKAARKTSSSDTKIKRLENENSESADAKSVEIEMTSVAKEELPSITLEELMELVQAPRDLKPSTEPIRIREVPGFFRQFAYFFMRDCVRIYRESAGVLANCFLQAMVGTMLGVLYGGDWALFKLAEIALALATFSSLFGGLLAINLLGPERLLNYREAAAGTNQHAYFLNKLLLNILYCVLHTTSLLLVFYPLINFPFSYSLLWSWVFLCFFVASGFGLFLAVIHRAPHVVVGIILTVINLFLGGALVTLKDLGSAAFITVISPARWLATLVMSYALESLPDQWESTRTALEGQFEFYYEDRFKAIVALLVMGVVLRIAAYTAHFLWERDKK